MSINLKNLPEHLTSSNEINQHTEKILPHPKEIFTIDPYKNIFPTASAAYLILKYGNYDLIHSIIHERSIGRDVKSVFSEIPEIRNSYVFGTKIHQRVI